MSNSTTISPSDMKRMGFTLYDRGGCLWWERNHPSVPALRFVVRAPSELCRQDGIFTIMPIVRLPAECMTLHGDEQDGNPATCLFAGHCTGDQIGLLANEMCAMTPSAVRIMLMAMA